MILFLNLNYSFLCCSIYNTKSTGTVGITQQNKNILHTCNMCQLCVCVCVCWISVVIPVLPGQSPASDPDIHADLTTDPRGFTSLSSAALV